MEVFGVLGLLSDVLGLVQVACVLDVLHLCKDCCVGHSWLCSLMHILQVARIGLFASYG